MRVIAILLSTLSGILITASIFLWFAAGEIYDYQDTFNLSRDGTQTDVVVVLAGGKKRIPIAVELWRKIKESRTPDHEPILFLSGVGPNAGNETLLEQGISKETIALLTKDKVIFENVSENTFENAELFLSFARQKKWKHAVLVTAGYHMRRAEFILKKVIGDEVEIKTATVDAVHFDRNEWHKNAYAVRVTLMEYVKLLYYRYHY